MLSLHEVDPAEPDHLAPLRAVTRRLWSPGQRVHVGDLAWGRWSVPGPGPTLAWWEADGRPAAWAWADQPGWCELLVDPAVDGLADAVVAWCLSVLVGPQIATLVMEDDRTVRAALERRGLAVQDDAPFFRRHDHDLRDLPEVVLPDGYAVRPVRAGEADRRAAQHREGWSDLGPSRVSTESYERVMSAEPYRAETDLVVEAPDGSWVASALGWLDEATGVGLVARVVRSRTPPAGSGPRGRPRTPPHLRRPRGGLGGRGAARRRRLPGASPSLPEHRVPPGGPHGVLRPTARVTAPSRAPARGCRPGAAPS